MLNGFRAVALLMLLHASTVVVAQPESTGTPPSTATAPINAPGNPPLRTANTTWGEALNPEAGAPLNAFKAFYINTNRPREVIAEEQVNDVAINYSWDDFHGIKSEDFGAYWVGRMRFAKAELRMLGINQSWSKTRIIIDGNIAFEGGQNATVPYQFAAGDHLIEVEYVNNWHTTGFKLSFGNHVRLNTVDQVRAALAGRNLPEKLDAHYVAVYEAKRNDHTVVLDVSALTRPSIIVVSSYDAVKWLFTPTNSRRIKAVIVASHSPGSEVAGVDEKKATVVHYRKEIGSYELKPSCTCVAGHYHCEAETSLASLAKTVEDISGSPLRGLNGSYYGERFALPGTLVSDAALAQDRAQRAAEADREKACKRNASPNFEDMMKQ